MDDHRADWSRRGFIKGSLTAAGLAAVGAGTGRAGVQGSTPVGGSGGGMPVRKLPRGGAAVPVYGLGTATLMPQYSPIPDAEKVRLIRLAYDKGVRYFDTAFIYRTEPYVGEALKDVRDDVYLATKVMAPDGPTARRQVESSLRSLQTDVIDCVKVHLASDLDQSLAVLDELEKLKAAGTIRQIGMSNHVFFEVALALIETGRLDEFLVARSYFPKGETEILSPYNLALREMCIARAHAQGMNLIGMKAMGGFMYGLMSGMWAPDYPQQKATRLPADALRWCLSDPRFHVYIIGVARPDEIDDTIRTASGDLTLTDDDRMLLAEFSSEVWQSEAVKLCPRPFAEPGVDDGEVIREGRARVMEKVGEHITKLLAESGGALG